MSKEINEQLKHGGKWLGAARTWLQLNVKQGDSINWSSAQPVSVPFCDFEDFARHVAVAAIEEDRNKRPVSS